MERDYFNALKVVPEARKKMLEMCPLSGKVYLAVGTMSIQTAQFKCTGSRFNDTTVTGKLLVGAAVAASTGVLVSPGKFQSRN